MTAPSETYDEVPYESYAYPQSHPDNLATIATLFGMEPRLLDGARVLEIGCAGGGNLLPVAAAYPRSGFVGIDISPLQIAQAQAGVDALQMRNVELRAMGLENLGEAFGTFDYIIAHGVYSWVAAPVREALMALCGRLLNPHGVAYISFNTLPGARTRDTLREMAGYHALNVSDLRDRIGRTRALFAFLQDACENREDTWAVSLKEELSQIAGVSDSYIAHEYLEEAGRPLYFHEFIDHARRHGLQYLGDAEMQTMSSGDFPASVRNSLRAMAGSIEEAEQYSDFVRNRAFRQTLLCRDSVALKRAISPETLQRLHVASSLNPVSGDGTGSRFRDARGMVFEIPDPLTRAALGALRDVWPECVKFEALGKIASQRAAIPLTPGQSAILAKGLLTCYSSTRDLEFRLHPTLFYPEVSEFPQARNIVRWQATQGSRVVNARHENVLLSAEEKALLPLLDGTRSLPSLAREFENAPAILEHFARVALLVA
ncbi:MAG TPA: class I SAM-dependent methyltransferase [Verrucomicrobiales bacterium]|nr:class I SAM-dependent methyltransferase [Verrucomicrobiales bacterium]